MPFVRPVTVFFVAVEPVLAAAPAGVHVTPSLLVWTTYSTSGDALSAGSVQDTSRAPSSDFATSPGGVPGTSASEMANDVDPSTLLGRSVLLARSVRRPAVPGTLALVVAVST